MSDSFLNKRMAILFRDAEWNSVMTHMPASDLLDLPNVHYNKLSYLDGISERQTRVFDLERSGRLRKINRNQPFICKLNEFYKEHLIQRRHMPEPSTHILGLYTSEIRRFFPQDWQNDFEFLKLAPINRMSSQVTLKEVPYLENITAPNAQDEVFRYNKRLKINIKMALLLRHFKMQSQLVGFYKPPKSSSWPNPAFFDQFDADQESLRDFAVNVADDTNSLFQTVMADLNNCANNYFSEQHLENSHFWIEALAMPFEYSKHLRHYNEMKNSIGDIVYNAYDVLFQSYRKLLTDFIKLSEKLIDR